MKISFVLVLLGLAISQRGCLARISLYTPTLGSFFNDLVLSRPPGATTFGNGCKVNMNEDLNPNQPLFVVPGTEDFYTPLPNTTDLLFQKGEQIELFCTGGFARNKASLTVTCDEDDLFTFDGKTYHISDLSCRSPAYHTATRTGELCFNNATVIKVGFKLDSRYLTLYEACYDEKVFRTYYVKHALNPWNSKHQVSKRPSGFIQGEFFADLEVSNLYTFNQQRHTLGRILGSQQHADTFLNKNKDFFLARGHLTAKADYVYGSHQQATFWFINVAPQWQKFNGVNWQRVETGVKDFVSRRNITVTVYTGTYGVLELPDVNGDPQELYLDFDPDNGGRIPVPKFYYKILHDEEGDAGIALIGVNNPHAKLEDIKENYVLCKDVSDEIDWLNWKPESIPGGYSYACDVNEFVAVTQHLPQLEKISKILGVESEELLNVNIS